MIHFLISKDKYNDTIFRYLKRMSLKKIWGRNFK